MINTDIKRLSLIFCFLFILNTASCSEHRDTDINIPGISRRQDSDISDISDMDVYSDPDISDNTENSEDSENNSIVLHDPVITEQDKNVIRIDNADFLGIKIDDERYAVYMFNGISLGSFSIISGKNYLFKVYDFSECPVMLFNGSLTAKHVMGEYRIGDILRIDGRRPVSISDIMQTCKYLPDMSRSIKYKSGMWHGVRLGMDYVITSINDRSQKRTYYFAISDKSFSLYLDWSSLLDHFVI